jgi:hypothetical protein
MARKWTWRRTLGAFLALVVLGAAAGGVAVRVAKKSADEKKGKEAPVAPRISLAWRRSRLGAGYPFPAPSSR